jgi:hypothetical protein
VINREREDGFEASFVVSTARRDAWEWLTKAAPAFEGLGTARDGQWWMPGWEAPGDELECVPEEKLRVRKAVEPCKGTEIVIVLEDADSGTRISIVQTGFGEGFAQRRPWLTAGWWQILADVVTFFERRVSLGRHPQMWWSIGCDVRETGEGLVVQSIEPTGFAADAGLEPGDLIVKLAGSPIIDVHDLSILTRGPLRTGVETKVHYLRGDEVRSGTGTI